jgi:phytoene dehydrogenase-like protein
MSPGKSQKGKTGTTLRAAVSSSKRGGPRAAQPAISRRVFLSTAALTLGAVCATPFLSRQRRRHFAGSIVGGNASLGHALRDGKFPAISGTAETGIAIIGGGIAGLSAARRLYRKGFSDFILLEMESRPGGNAISGENEISAYPWGAHYVPIAGSDSAEVADLFEDLGVITGRDASDLPIYNEEFLCADPMERLFIHGRWQEGFVPQLGVADSDQQVFQLFFDEMRRFQTARGSDGRRAFTIPLDASSHDDEFTRLDRITMADYLRVKGWLNSVPLRWFVNYCCRDDYGAGIEKVSAWAGVHYFASRDGRAANAAGYAVVTWPEGNGWFVRQLQSGIASNIRSSCAVWNVEIENGRVLVDYFDATRQKSVRLRAKGVVWAAPHFIAQRAVLSLRDQPPASPTYSPWMVANLTLSAMPAGHGVDLAWDNVLYDSNSLGYVVATHQDVHPVPRRTVLTYYQPLDDDDPSIARQKALARSYKEWCELILADLSQAHPDIANHLTNLDVWLWGHAMVRPVPGFIWGASRSQMQQPLHNIVFAHSDLSGIAIFEEAYTRGVRAADLLLEQLKDPTRNA